LDPRAAHLIGTLGLSPHPEGGYYRRIFGSTSTVSPRDGRGERAAVSTIYYLLVAGDVSRWHRVASDEVWHHYEGAPLEMFTADPALDRVDANTLGTLADSTRPVVVVPAGMWQAARTTGEYTLVGCTVAPGFDFEDFELLRDAPAIAAEMRRRHPGLASLI